MQPPVVAVVAVRSAMSAESLTMPRISVMHPVSVLPGRPGTPPAQQAERGDDRVERIRVLGIVRHTPILHAT